MFNQNQRGYGNQNYQSGYQQSNFQQKSYQSQNLQQQANPMKIKNPQTNQLPTVKGPEMNDRDRLNDMLATEKYLTDNYNVFAREASYNDLHKDVCQILNQTHQEARGLFNFMFNKGWYSLQAESTQQVAQVQQQFTNYQTQFAQNQQVTNSQSGNQNYHNQMY